MELSWLAEDAAVERIARSVDANAWLSGSPVRTVHLFTELTLAGRRLSGTGRWAEVLPEKHVATQRIKRDGTVSIWTTVGAEQLLEFPDQATGEKFWQDWFLAALREMGVRRGLRPLDDFWIASTEKA